ncbi:hypothetical protein B0H14DRAFT_2819092 [Mycena olivaceomarginata]|nr:hypothetical protein B0H14DRAFT_2819029 [Mycena olivaceomarginata]KAJ7825928.1 hypothetical protein B0H14DRAFT_2819092 [Mycena olivaceomarginata]
MWLTTYKLAQMPSISFNHACKACRFAVSPFPWRRRPKCSPARSASRNFRESELWGKSTPVAMGLYPGLRFPSSVMLSKWIPISPVEIPTRTFCPMRSSKDSISPCTNRRKAATVRWWPPCKSTVSAVNHCTVLGDFRASVCAAFQNTGSQLRRMENGE